MCAKLSQGIFGGIRGKVGNLVGSSWKGIPVIKTLPLSVANPKTAAQVGNRTAFKQAVLDASTLLVELVKPLWDRNAQKQSGNNAFVSSNKQAYSTSGVLDVTKFIPTLGKLAAEAIINAAFNTGDEIVTFDWVNNAGTGEKLATDVAYIVAYNATQNIWAANSGNFVRSDAGGEVAFDANMEAGDLVSVWLAFRGIAANQPLFKAGPDLSNTVQ